MLLQDFTGTGYDVAWATHALYALPPAELAAGVAKMVAALRPGGFGVVAQASSRSHYLTFYDAYRASFAPDATPYTDAEGVAAALRAPGHRSRCRCCTTAPGRPTGPSPRASCSAARSTTR